MSDDDGSQAGEGRKRSGKSGGGRSFPAPRPKVISGPLGASIDRGVPHCGPATHVDGQRITNYPNANKPVLLRRRCMRHHPHAWFDYVVSHQQQDGGGGSVSSSFASGRPTMPTLSDSAPYVKVPMGPPMPRKVPTVHHMVHLALPMSWLEPNPDSLVHFKTNTPDDCLRAICMSFLLTALSQTDINLSVDSETTAHTTGGTFRAADGQIYPRTSTFIHTIFAPDASNPDDWDPLLSGLPRDPVLGEDATAALNPNISVLNELVQPGNKVGYLIAVAIHDPDLHPNALFAYNILSNRLIKGVEDYRRHEDYVAGLKHRYKKFSSLARGFANDEGLVVTKSVPTTTGEAAKEKKKNKKKEKKSDEAEEASEGAEDRLHEDENAEAEEAEAARAEAEERVARRKADPERHDYMMLAAARIAASAAKDGNLLLGGDDDGSSSPDEDFDPERDEGEADEVMKDAADQEEKNTARNDGEESEGGEEGTTDSRGKAKKGTAADPSEMDKDEEDGEEEDALRPRESDDELDSEEEEELREMETGVKAKRGGDDEAEEAEEDDEDAKKLAEIRKRQAKLKEDAAAIAAGDASRQVPLDDSPEDIEYRKKEAENRKSVGTAYYANERNRLHLGRNAKEKLPWYYGRYVLTLKELSALVMHTYLTEAGSERTRGHEDGLYDDEHNLETSVYQYNMYGIDTPLYYAEFFSFENARQILLRNFPGRIGTVSLGASPQFSFEAYNGTKDDPVLRVPFPWMCTEYKTADLNPEYLCWYRTPGALSAVEAILDAAQDALQKHEDALRANPLARNIYEHPRDGVPEIVQETYDAFESARPAQVPPATDVLHQLKDLFTPGVPDFSKNRSAIYTRISATSTKPVSEFGADINHVRSLTPLGECSSRLSGKRRMATAEDIAEREQQVKRHHRDIISWLNYSLHLAKTVEDRQAIHDAITAIGGAADPSQIIREIDTGTGKHGPVRACCARLTTAARGNEGGRALSVKTSAAAANPTAQAFLSIYCNHTDRAEQELSVSRVTGPIERLRDARIKLRDEIFALNQRMPFRSNTTALREWLDRTDVGWRLRQTRKPTEMDAQRYGLTVSDVEVLWAMDFTHEERYRNEWLCTAMRAFRAETTVEVCSTLSVNNTDLPNSIRAALVWLNTRPQGRNFVHPVMPFDPTLSQFATYFAHEAVVLAHTQKVNEVLIAPMVVSLCTTRLSQLMVNRTSMPNAELILGPPGTSKTEFMKTVVAASPTAGVVPSHHKSRLSDMASDNKESTATLLVHDEAPAWMVASAADFKLDNREHRDMLKSVFTQQEVSYQRIVKGEDGKMRRESRVVPYVFNILTASNRYNAPADISDRIRLHTTFSVISRIRYGGGRELRLGGGTKDPDLQAAITAWQNERFDEYLLAVFVEYLEACGALSINTKVLSTIITAGDAVLTKWYGNKFSNVSARLTGRAESDCRQFTLISAYQRTLRSPLSPYLKSTTEQIEVDDGTGRKAEMTVPRLAIDTSRAFVPSDITHLFQTRLFASYGEAIPAYWNYLTIEALPINHWRLLYAIASCLMGFTSDYFEPSYYRYGIEVPDVLERASQRHGRTFRRRSEVCSFLADYYNFTGLLRSRAYETQRALSFWGLSSEERERHSKEFGATPRPQFATVDQIARLIPSAADTFAGKRRAAGAKPGSGGSVPTQPDLNPSILLREFVGTEEDLLRQIHAAVSHVIGGVDKEVIKSMLSTLSDFMVEVPWHRSQNAATISAATLAFDGVHTQPDAPMIRNDDDTVVPLRDDQKTGKLVTKILSVFRLDLDNATGKLFIAIPTYALMCPWPEVHYLALCAHEGPNTRACRAVLPLGHTEAPTLMHIWDVMPNVHGTTSIHTGNRFSSVTAASRMRISVPTVLGGDDASREQQRRMQAEADARRSYLLQLRERANSDSSGDPSAGFDCEMNEFARYLQSIQYVPPRGFPDPPVDMLSVKDRYAWYAKRMIDAPGNTDAYIYHMWRTCPDLNNGELRPADERPLVYPDHDVKEANNENALAAARMLYETNLTQFIDELEWAKFEKAVGAASPEALENVRRVRDFDTDVRDGKKSIRDRTAMRDAVHISFHMWNEERKRCDLAASRRDRLEAAKRNGISTIVKRCDEEGYENVIDYLRACGGRAPSFSASENTDEASRERPASPVRTSDVDANEAIRRIGEKSSRMMTVPSLSEMMRQKQRRRSAANRKDA